jgi:hypothetical protein
MKSPVHPTQGAQVQALRRRITRLIAYFARSG